MNARWLGLVLVVGGTAGVAAQQAATPAAVPPRMRLKSTFAEATPIPKPFTCLPEGGPCPPPGTGPIHYVFTLYALDQMLTVPAGSARADVAKAMDGHILGSNILLGLFER